MCIHFSTMCTCNGTTLCAAERPSRRRRHLQTTQRRARFERSVKHAAPMRRAAFDEPLAERAKNAALPTRFGTVECVFSTSSLRFRLQRRFRSAEVLERPHIEAIIFIFIWCENNIITLSTRSPSSHPHTHKQSVCTSPHLRIISDRFARREHPHRSKRRQPL